MKKKRLSKILSTLCAIATMTLCFSKVQAAPIENTESIDSSKSYIIYSGDTKVTLYDDGGNKEGWLRQGNYLDFDKSYSWKIEKKGSNFYLKNEGTDWYVKGTSKDLVNNSVTTSYVVSDKENSGNDKGEFSFEKVEGGYKIKSVSNNKYIIYGENQNYVTYTNDKSKANVWKIEEKPEYNNSKDYIIYSTSKDNTLYDSGGNNEGWLQKDKYVEFADKFSWKIEANDTGFYLKNVGTSWYVKGNGKDLDSKQYVVSDKKTGSEKGSYKLEKVINGYKIKSLTNDKYIMYGENGNYITFTNDVNKAMIWKIEVAPVYTKPEGSIALWENPVGSNYYRIPAIATANDGTLLAINDLRYGHAGDLGNHRIDLLLKNSTDNGLKWSDDTNLTVEHSKDGYGFGDAAIVADRESDKVIILAATGDKGFWHGNINYVSTRKDPIKVSKFVSNDGGKTFSAPQDITSEIYGLNEAWTRLFVTSGRIMQSRYIKVGDYYRIYTALLVGPGNSTKENFVIYSDDFGDTWKVLGSTKSPVPNGDEAKVEELPNGNVVIASRTGKGRFINVFTYDENDTTYSKGQWESNYKSLKLGEGSATNGETYIVYAKDTATNEYKYIALQSLPTIGNSRNGVGIYYKEVDVNSATASDFVNGWNESNFYMVQERQSAYSTFSIQDDGKIAFFYEDRNRGGYDAQFLSLDLKTVTNGKYEMAFTGIGSEKSPYVVETKDQLEAVNGIFNNEKVNWVYNIAPETPVSTQTEATENSAVITWSKAEDNGLTQGYNIYNSAGERLNKTIVTEEKFEIQNLQPGTEYTYTVKAVNKDGVESEAAKIVFNTKSVETPVDPEVPVDPETPVDPEVPEDPETPVNPETPTQPENQTNLDGKDTENTEKPADATKPTEDKKPVNSDNKSTIKVSENTNKNVKAQNNNKVITGGKGLVSTGDTVNVAGLIGVVLFSASALVGLSLKKKK